MYKMPWQPDLLPLAIYSLFENGLQTLQNLCSVSNPLRIVGCCIGGDFSYLNLNLGLRDVLLTSTAARDLLRLGELGPDGVGAEVLQGVALDSVDAQKRVGLDGSECAGHYINRSFSMWTPL